MIAIRILVIQSLVHKNFTHVNEFPTMHGYLCIITTGPLAAKLGGSALTDASKLVGNTEIAGNYIKIEL